MLVKRSKDSELTQYIKENQDKCVQCGYCCQVGVCMHGSWNEKKKQCTHLTNQYKCGIYSLIKDDMMFGSGCTSILFNEKRTLKMIDDFKEKRDES